MSEMIKTIGNKKLLADYNTEGKKLALKEDALVAGDNITIENNVISSDQLFVAEYDVTTYAEIKAAYEAGKICMCKKSNDTFASLYAVTSTAYRFQYLNAVSRAAQSWSVSNANEWASLGFVTQPKLTFDTTPTAGSTNPVTSNGIKAAIDTKQDALTAGTGIAIDNNVISATGSGTLFTAVYDETPFADIKAAYDAGQIVQCKYINAILQLGAINNAIAQFSRTYVDNNAMAMTQAQCTSAGWSIVNI